MEDAFHDKSSAIRAPVISAFDQPRRELRSEVIAEITAYVQTDYLYFPSLKDF